MKTLLCPKCRSERKQFMGFFVGPSVHPSKRKMIQKSYKCLSCGHIYRVPANYFAPTAKVREQEHTIESKGVCIECGTTENYHAKGLCKKCYRKWRYKATGK